MTNYVVDVEHDSLVFEVDHGGNIHMHYPHGVDPKNVHPVWTMVSFLLSQKMQDKAWVDEISAEMARWTPADNKEEAVH